MTGITCALAGGGPRPGVLTTVSFTSNGTWVAPVGVSTVVSASGKGADGVSDTIGNVYTAAYWATPGGSAALPNAPYAQWSTIYGNYLTLLNTLASKSYPSYAPTNPLPYYSFTTVVANDTWDNSTATFPGVAYYLTGYSTTTIGSPQASGNITYAGLTGLSGWTIDVTGYVPGGAGAASTALGLTFPGGTYTGSYPNGVGNAATTTTFTNVAVTPGTSYPIVVPSGGVVTLQYYV